MVRVLALKQHNNSLEMSSKYNTIIVVFWKLPLFDLFTKKHICIKVVNVRTETLGHISSRINYPIIVNEYLPNTFK